MRWLLVISALVAGSCGIAARAADSAVVLMYHRFGDDRFASTNIRVDQFEAHLAHLKEAGYSVIPVTALMRSLKDGTPLPERAVVITVDDAYRSVREVAHPLLKRYGYPYTVFVATDGVDAGLPDYMSWDEMRSLEAEGVTFANHGASHESLIGRPQSGRDYVARARDDVEKGMDRLREELDPVEFVFAYPYGEFNHDVVDMIDGLGYEVAFGQHSGAIGPMSDRFTLPRFPMNETYATIDQFRTKVASLPLPVESVDPPDYEIVTRLPLIEVELPGGIDSGEFGGLACFVGGQGRVTVDWIVRNERFRVGPERPLSPGRNRVNCTAPAGDGRYHWYSHPWFVVDP